MFSIFKNKSSKVRCGPDTNSPAQFRMNLDERKAYRREMLYQSIRENMLGLEALSSMYKFKVMNIDERHHRFIVMIEVASQFEAKKGGMTIGFTQIEGLLKTRTFERYGVRLDGIFWRVNESQQSFVRANRASDTRQSEGPAFNVQRQREIPGDVRNAREHLSRHHQYEPVTEQERIAFEDAVKRGQRPPTLHVGRQEYQSDLAPLETTADVGGTQYGQL
jgi:hypothetical protein